MGLCASELDPENVAPTVAAATEEPSVERKDSLIRPIVQANKGNIYNSFSLGFKQLGVGLNGAVRAVKHIETGISYGKRHS